MTGFELHDAETEENMGAVIVIKKSNEEFADVAISEGWEDFNKLEETEGDHTSVDEFVEWFNESHDTQIERLYLEFIQP